MCRKLRFVIIIIFSIFFFSICTNLFTQKSSEYCSIQRNEMKRTQNSTSLFHFIIWVIDLLRCKDLPYSTQTHLQTWVKHKTWATYALLRFQFEDESQRNYINWVVGIVASYVRIDKWSATTQYTHLAKFLFYVSLALSISLALVIHLLFRNYTRMNHTRTRVTSVEWLIVRETKLNFDTYCNWILWKSAISVSMQPKTVDFWDFFFVFFWFGRSTEIDAHQTYERKRFILYQQNQFSARLL